MERLRHVLMIAASGCALSFLAACATELGVLEDELRYSHARHLNENVTCLDCHTGIDQAATLSRTFIPDHSACRNCHSTEDDKTCGLCHSRPDKALRSEARASGLIFSHERHMQEAKGNCIRCHNDIPRAETAEQTHGPKMNMCGGECHGDLLVNMECQKCHRDFTQYGLERIRLVAHGQGFEREHGRIARQSSETCLQCHDRTSCADCHMNTKHIAPEVALADRPTRAFIHPAPYVAMHTIDAERRPDTCDACHRPTFCASCHASFGIAVVANLGRAPHPPGWLDPTSARFHGDEARRRITACASCHDQGGASVCVRCHQVGGTGGNPHPPGFGRREKPQDNRACRVCHTR